MQRSALCRSRRELSNAYFLAKFGLDTAENEPCQVCPTPRNAAALAPGGLLRPERQPRHPPGAAARAAPALGPAARRSGPLKLNPGALEHNQHDFSFTRIIFLFSRIIFSLEYIFISSRIDSPLELFFFPLELLPQKGA